MLTGLCRFVIIGHSERRQYFGDSDEVVNRKLVAALNAGLTPIVCVGEQLADNEAGRTEEVVARQLRAALTGISVSADLVIAYEPVWAIGTGRTASGKAANETAHMIRQTIGALAGNDVADGVRVLYGGSVTADNVAEFMEQMDISGALVGGASLNAADFVSIAKQTEDIFFPNNPPMKDLIPW
jgi:triosephosphate isomerase